MPNTIDSLRVKLRKQQVETDKLLAEAYREHRDKVGTIRYILKYSKFTDEQIDTVCRVLNINWND